MKRAVFPLAVLLLTILGAGCAETGVGDPCTPQHPALQPGMMDCPYATGSSCFQGSEIYIETRSLQCRTRVCMVYKWDELMNFDQQSQRVFCTCRCGGEGDPTSFCTCPTGFQCTTAFVAGEPGIRGSYCVRCEALGGCDAGTM